MIEGATLFGLAILILYAVSMTYLFYDQRKQKIVSWNKEAEQKERIKFLEDVVSTLHENIEYNNLHKD